MIRGIGRRGLGLAAGFVGGAALAASVQACDVWCGAGENDPPVAARFLDPDTNPPYGYAFPVDARAPFHDDDPQGVGALVVDVRAGTATLSYPTSAGDKVEVWSLVDVALRGGAPP